MKTLLLLVTVTSFCLTRIEAELSPGSPNVCLVHDTVLVSRRVSATKPYEQVYYTSCTDIINLFRCTRRRTMYRVQYESKWISQVQAVYRCCAGYVEVGSYCQAVCQPQCVHGICQSPNQCSCEAGWRGDTCSSACDNSHYGPHCLQQCLCFNNATCNPVDGSCACLPGHYGDHCEFFCPAGTYGESCRQTCQCQNGATCDPVTGACSCSPGFTGPYCEQRCSPGFHGDQCAQECQCQNGATCHHIHGLCECRAGFTNEVCGEPCPEGTYGINCSGTCNCHNGAVCNVTTGQCSCPPGYSGGRCEKECDVGFYGPNCLKQCSCETSPCNPRTGVCQCLPGYRGKRCQHECQDGYYGLNCSHRCTCRNGGTCSPFDGSCRCPRGFKGEDCEDVCPQGMFGDGCRYPCDCANRAQCDPVSGVCNCSRGWRGPTCSESCDHGHYGKDCKEECLCENDASCDPVNGDCYCKAGYMGRFCDQECSPGYYGLYCKQQCLHCDNGTTCDRVTGACYPSVLSGRTGDKVESLDPAGAGKHIALIIGVVIMVILLVLLIMVVVWYRRRLREEKQKRLNGLPSVVYQATTRPNDYTNADDIVAAAVTDTKTPPDLPNPLYRNQPAHGGRPVPTAPPNMTNNVLFTSFKNLEMEKLGAVGGAEEHVYAEADDYKINRDPNELGACGGSDPRYEDMRTKLTNKGKGVFLPLSTHSDSDDESYSSPESPILLDNPYENDTFGSAENIDAHIYDTIPQRAPYTIPLPDRIASSC
ncbi:uncharacterized protein LOC144908562 isoform X4 [Branchiostoma floridae x Branchiostoma belcheri]